MDRKSRPRLSLTAEEERTLREIAETGSGRRAQRAEALLAWAGTETISDIARRVGCSRPTVQRMIDRAHELGAVESLKDRHRSGRPKRITDKARRWLVSLASEPRADGRRWTYSLLSHHIRTYASDAGHPCLCKVTPGTVSRILHGAGSPLPKPASRRTSELEARRKVKAHVRRLEKLIARSGLSDSEIEARLEWEPSELREKLKHPTSVRFEDMVAILHAIGVEPDWLFSDSHTVDPQLNL